MEDKIQLLKSQPLFASLGASALALLAGRADLVALRKGETVIREGEPGDALYIVVSGRCRAFTRLPTGQPRVFTFYKAGDAFGETALVSSEPHWCSVEIVNDAVLLRVRREEFDTSIRARPAVAKALTTVMSQRLREVGEQRRRAKQSVVVAVYSAISKVSKTIFATNLAASLAHETREPVGLLRVVFDPQERCLADCQLLSAQNGRALEPLTQTTPHGYDSLCVRIVGHPNEPRIVPDLFSCLVQRYHYIVVDLPNEYSDTIFECLRQSDQTFLLCRRTDDHLYKTRLLLDDLRMQQVHDHTDLKVLITGLEPRQMTGLADLEQHVGHPIHGGLEFIPEPLFESATNGHPFVLRHSEARFSRSVRYIARELGHCLVGLALGSGAARGLAHIGVIRVLEQEKIPVDIVTGSSMGALVAAAWAVGKTADEMEQIAMGVKSKRAIWSLLDPVFPFTGFLRGHKVYGLLRRILDDLTFGDTVIRTRIVATNLDTTEEVVFADGSLVDAVRASLSMPGVFMPVVRDGTTMIDGGIASPVPVDVLVRMGVGRIIAVNTIPNIEDNRTFTAVRQEFCALPERRRQLLGNLTRQVRCWSSYNILDVFFRSMYAMQSQIAEAACRNADVTLRPIVPGGLWWDFLHPELYIARGEECARAALPALRKLAMSPTEDAAAVNTQM